MCPSFKALIFIILLNGRSTLQEDPIQCGVRKLGKQAMIVNGYDTVPGAWPWHTAIYHKKWITHEYACGGTLISAQFVLTSAHCTVDPDSSYDLPPQRIAIRLGAHNLNDLRTQQQHDVHKIYKPDNFSSESLRDDIAILELHSLARFNDYVQPACLGINEDLTGQLGTVIGWGVTEDDVTSPVLKSARMPIIAIITCLKSNRDLFGQTLDESTMCAGYTNGTSVCNGDSGGGLFIEKDKRWYLSGIVSYTQQREDGRNRCHTKGYGAFANVDVYLPWISTVTKMKFENGNNTSPADLSPTVPSTTSLPSPATANGWMHPKLNLLPKDCGVKVTDRISYGNTTKVFEYPWMAIVRHEYRDEIIDACGGSVINKRYVLTAAQCVQERVSVGMPMHKRYVHSVVLGEHTKDQETDCNYDSYGLIQTDCAGPIEVFGIESFVAHPNFYKLEYSNDIALIRLDKDVVMKDHINPICLPVTSALQEAKFDRYILTGWGEDEIQQSSNILMQANLPYVSNPECQRRIRENQINVQLTNKQMCAGGINKVDACYGNLGDPLGFSAGYNGVRFIQFGIVSFGDEICGWRSVPGVYSRVSAYMDWILDNMEA